MQLNMKDHLRACKMVRRVPSWLGSLVALIAFGEGVFFYFKLGNHIGGWMLISSGILCVFCRIAQPIAIAYRLKSNPKLKRPWLLAASPVSIVVSSEDGESTLKWSAFQNYIENDDAFLLLIERSRFLIFPKRFFSSKQIDIFQSLIRGNVAPRGAGQQAVSPNFLANKP